ncbi:MAG TPA: ABC transporter permease [Firmicutes bacterium]|nr:ABC transporter permease [Bacillota bacterium]
MRTAKNRNLRIVNPVSIAFAIVIVLFAVGEVLSPGFASYSQILNVLRISSFLGLVAAGQTLVVLSGGEGIDLSVGAVVTLSAIMTFRIVMGSDARIPLALAEILAAGFALGAVNGLGIALLRIPPLVMTLGMTGVVHGIILVYTQGQPKGESAPFLKALVSDPWIFNIPGVLFIWLAFTVAMVILLRKTSFGARLYAVGSNRVAARLSGINVPGMLILVYGLSGLIAALTGFLLLGYTNFVFLNLGDSYQLPSVAAVVVGGTTLAGGSGGYMGTVAGAIVLTVLQSILVTLRLGEAGRQITYGIVLFALLSAYGRQRRLRQ